MQMDYEIIGEAFIINALVSWHHDIGVTLQVPHKAPSQAVRWHDAITAQIVAMVGTGQPAWNHACNVCTKHIRDEDGNVIQAY